MKRIGSEWAFLSAGTLASGGLLLWGYLRSGAEGVGFVGSLASVLSLLLTWYVALKVHEIRSRYVRQVMLRQCHARLAFLRRQLGLALRKEEVDRVREGLSQLAAVFAEISRHERSGRQLEWEMAEVREVLYSNSRLLIPRTRDLLAEVDRRIEALDLLLEAMNWGTDDE